MMHESYVEACRDSSQELQYRNMSIRLADNGAPASLNQEARSVECVMATEAPCRMYDYDRYEYVNEVLLMTGCEIPASRQVPLLDTHSRYDTSSVIGSTREISVSGGELIGRDYFSTAPEAEPVWLKTKEGHLTDRSIGYRYNREDAIFIPDGEKMVLSGREFTGPLKVVKRWQVKENSICPIGADENAKARARAEALAHPSTQKIRTETEEMNEKLRRFLEARGLAKDATEEEAWRFLETIPKGGETPDMEKEREAAALRERARIDDIRATGQAFDCDAALVDQMIRENKTEDEARKLIMAAHIEKKSTESTPGYRAPAIILADSVDKFRSAATDAVLQKAGVRVQAPAAGHDELMGYSLRELARESLRIARQRDGGDVRDMVGRALTSTDFPIILANIANKSLATGYETASETWQEWAGDGSVSDFKTHTMVRASETDDLDEIPENDQYKYGDMTEGKEEYKIATYGKLFAISRQAIINDDLNALTNIPKNHGEAASRKIGDVCYAVVTANSAMGDGVALFHTTTHGNLASSGAVVGVETLAAGIKAMKLQKDLQGKRRLNIKPNFFLAPATVEGTAEVFFASQWWDGSAKDATRTNPYAGNYFTRVYESRLDDDSLTAWYLLGPKGKTVVVYFLNGIKAPYMETKAGWSVDGAEYKVRIDCGAKAVDWKAMYKNAGA